jgi:hypothetical protein
MRRIMTAMAALVLWAGASGCNGLLVVERGPKAGELNWLGRTACWAGFDNVGLGEVEEVDGAYDVEGEHDTR